MRRLLALLLLLPTAPAALAAESYDGCAGFIDALPATISTQGVWCLRRDLATAITDGAAITIATNNVTIDCNGFKLGGLAAGPTSGTSGIRAEERINATVRNCAIRGFHTGVRLVGNNSAGHLVEDNRIDQSLVYGIKVSGVGNLVQRNRIFDTGNAESSPIGIFAEADIFDNVVDGVLGAAGVGIHAGGWATEVRGNKIRNLVPAPEYGADGIVTFGFQQSIVDNRIVNQAGGSGAGIIASGDASFCRDNTVVGFEPNILMCGDSGGNIVD